MISHSDEDRAVQIINEVYLLNPGMMLEVLIRVMVMDGIAEGRRRQAEVDAGICRDEADKEAAKGGPLDKVAATAMRICGSAIKVAAAKGIK